MHLINYSLQVALDTNYWNPIIHVSIWGSILSWLVVPPFLSNIVPLYVLDAATYFGVANEVLASSMFWWYLIIATMIALVPIIAIRIGATELWPTLLDDVKLLETNKRSEELVESLKKQFHKDDDDSIPVVPSRWRTGYAFAHEEGFGQIISTGRYLGALADDVEKERIQRTGTWMRDNKRRKKTAIEEGLSQGLDTSIGVAITAGNKEPASDPTPPTSDPTPPTSDPTPPTNDSTLPTSDPTPPTSDPTPPTSDPTPTPPTSDPTPPIIDSTLDESDINYTDQEIEL